MKDKTFNPYKIDDTFTISKEVLSMNPEQRKQEIKKYEAIMQKSRISRQKAGEKQFA